MEDTTTRPVSEIVAALHTDPHSGLTGPEAAQRLAKFGPNILEAKAARNPWSILAAQFASVLVVVLLAACLVSFLLGDVKDAVAIFVIVVLNAALGFRQEFKAEKAMAALHKLSEPMVHVRRDGALLELEAEKVVPGDIMLLEAGNVLVADGRLTECASLRAEEASLTGESLPVEKSIDPLQNAKAALAERKNMVYRGTVITYGRGEAVVTATGMKTEIGRVASLLGETEDEKTPLSRKINHLGRMLAALALVVIATVTGMGLVRGEPIRTLFLTAVSLAVAAVPEGLPAVVTIALALGAQRMFKRKALIRNLPAVEALGGVTAICTDKTGTLTQNRMTLSTVSLLSGRVNLDTGRSPSPDGIRRNPDLCLSLLAGSLCNDAVLEANPGEDDYPQAVGDATEAAILVAASRLGLDQAALESVLPRIGEVPFDSNRKRMSTVHRVAIGSSLSPFPFPDTLKPLGVPNDGGVIVAVKGAPDSILPLAASVLDSGVVRPITPADQTAFAQEVDRLAADGIRVLAVAARSLPAPPATVSAEVLESELILVGIVGMIDPLREDVGEAVVTCRNAGIRPIMITGDHPLIAAHIGSQLGLATDTVLVGPAVEAMDATKLRAMAANVSVFARVSPEHKLRIVDALQENGELVAMTGDGVNDAPALKSADIGVAMGITGTDVAKEASDMVLLDDRYATIVAAVREGRVIFDNVRRFIRFILASNAGEILVMLAAPLLRMPLPLLPVQILWMNLVTDGLPALALAVEPAERDVMTRPPRNPSSPIIDRLMGFRIGWVGLVMAALCLAVGASSWSNGAAEWQTMLFTTMVMSQIFFALGVRSDRDSLLRVGLLTNKPLLLAILATFLLQLAVVYIPVCQGFFHTAALSAGQLTLCIGSSLVLLVAAEIEKAVIVRLTRRKKETSIV